MSKTTYCVILSLLLSVLIAGCVFAKKPAVVDPCANAPTQCWVGKGRIGVDPNTIPTCVELIKCHSWSMSAK